MSGEEWRPIPGYGGSYSVSNLGRVRSEERTVPWLKFKEPRVKKLSQQILCQCLTNRGYAFVSLRRDSKTVTIRVHTLVLLAFRGPALDRHCNHLNSNKLDNRIENLEWTSNIENMAHAVANGLIRHGEAHPKSKLLARDIPRIRAADQRDLFRLSQELGVTAPTLYAVRYGNTWRRA